MAGINRIWSDEERNRIERDVRKAFARDSRMSEARHLNIAFSGATQKAIHVSGSVPSESVRDRALQIVSRNIPGDIDVVDEMDIGT